MNKRQHAYLEMKQMGGRTNQQGNDYEIAFACYRIMQFMDRYPAHLHRIIFSSQYPGFVDDLFIGVDVPGHENEIFHQLKTGKNLSWGVGLGTLHDDFYLQSLGLKRAKKAFHLYLVVSNNGVFRRMVRNMPTKLRKIASVQEFPWFGSVSANCSHHRQFKRLAEHLCAFPDTDKLIALVKCICGQWVASNKTNIPLSQILNGVRQMGYSFLKSSIPVTLTDEVIEILRKIPDFQYKIMHGYFGWTYSSTDRGQNRHMVDSLEFRNIENDIIAKRPTTFNDLEPIIS